MRPLSDGALDHLRRVADRPEPAGDRYAVFEAIGQGGMGSVYRAQDRVLGREVALKVLRADLADGDWAERLEREARILARLEHPGIVPVHDVGRLADGRIYYLMKLVRGTRFDHFVREASREDTLRAFLRVCETVAFAHAQGVVHRDLKPSNIMVGAFGEVLVLDWGIARLGGGPGPSEPAAATGRPGAAGDTAPGTVLGTPGFMAPEQTLGQPVDARTDVYGLGAVLRAVLGERGGAAAIPRPLAAICDRSLAPDPEARYPSAADLAAEVSRFLDGRPVLAYREPWPERLARLYTRYQTAILLVVAYLAMRLLFLAFRGL